MECKGGPQLYDSYFWRIIMKRLLIILMLLSLPSFSQKAAIVVNPSIKDIKKEEIKDILLGMKRNRVILSKDKAVNEIAIEKLLGISYENFRVYWLERALAGEGNLPEEMNYKEAIREIKKNKKAIGILPAEKVKSSGLKVIMVID